MNVKKSEFLTIGLFCGFLFVMAACYLLLPKSDFSETEKRYLEEPPKLSWERLASGDWGNDVETYLADHIPGRNFFVGLNAYFDLYTGRQAGKDIRVAGDRLLEVPVKADSAAIAKNMAAINTFAQTLGQEVTLAIVPSAGWALGQEDYQDEAIIRSIHSAAEDGITPVDLLPVFAGQPELYYKTDHHWTSRGAYAAYAHLMTVLEKPVQPEEAYRKEKAALFRGSTYSRSALWLTEGEDLELWHSATPFTVTNAETEGVHDGVFYPERLAEADKYTVFLDGNHSLVRIHNPQGSGRLLVIRDSYSNSLGCFLAEAYKEVVLLDLRYYKQPISQLAVQEGFDDILVCYSIGNFMTDANIIWLR